ncbi:MAG: transketolase [Phycisphaerae bacterium]|nr:transketolase [Phycisphaerae bacterium]
MRNVFCQSLLSAAADPALVFLTGDLGFMALEPLRDAMGERFINGGVAEQNIVSVAAGLAREGFKPWCYSIAPFLYARALEQIRNDVGLHHLGVVIVGNGGGYGYGVMGATHHSTNDYGTISCQPQIKSFIPAFDSDVANMIASLVAHPEPAYLRLGLSELPTDFRLPPYAPWRKLLAGSCGTTIVACGPLVGGILSAAMTWPENQRPTIWLLSEMPIRELPADLLNRGDQLIAVEEHVAAGGMGQALAAKLLEHSIFPRRFIHRHAPDDTPTRYGSQKYHRRTCGIDAESILKICREA